MSDLYKRNYDNDGFGPVTIRRIYPPWWFVLYHRIRWALFWLKYGSKSMINTWRYTEPPAISLWRRRHDPLERNFIKLLIEELKAEEAIEELKRREQGSNLRGLVSQP